MKEDIKLAIEECLNKQLKGIREAQLSALTEFLNKGLSEGYRHWGYDSSSLYYNDMNIIAELLGLENVYHSIREGLYKEDSIDVYITPDYKIVKETNSNKELNNDDFILFKLLPRED